MAMKKDSRKLVSLWAAALLHILTRRGSRQELTRRMNRMEFRGSCRRMGVRFSETIRKAWRHRWLNIRRR